MSRSAENIVRTEIHYCVSSLVSTLAQGNGVGRDMVGADLSELTEQAAELCYPLPDFEEVAAQAGWSIDGGLFINHNEETTAQASPFDDNGWRDLCDEFEIDAYDAYGREVFEHWIVSDWLADRLAEKGEKVDKDFAGMTVWARTTTGQGIASDSVIEAIVADLAKGA
jgi:hypothetical protein